MNLKDFSGWKMVRHINTGFNNPHVMVYQGKWKGHTLECVVSDNKERYNAIGYSQEFSKLEFLIEYLKDKPVVEVLSDNFIGHSREAILKHVELLERAIDNLKDGRLIDNSYKSAKAKVKLIKGYIEQ